MRRMSFAIAVLFALLPAMALLAQGGELLVRSPMQGETVIGSTMTVHFETPGLTVIPSPVKVEEAGKHPEANRPGEGHLHLMLDLQPMVIWGSSDPYTFENIPPGDHVLTVEIVQNDHSSFTPPRLEQIRFTSVAVPSDAAPSEVPMVASLPNTGLTTSPFQPSTLALLVIGACLIAGGARVRRRS